MRLPLLRLFLFLTYLFQAPYLKAQSPAPAQLPVTVGSSTSEALGSSAVMDRIEAFNSHDDEVEAAIKNLGQLDSVRADFDGLKDKLEHSRRDFQRKSGLSSWDFRMASEFRAQTKPIFDDAEKIKSDYLAFLKDTDDRLSALSSEKEAFEAYQTRILDDSSLAAQRPAVRDAIATTLRFAMLIKKARENYTSIYQGGASVLDAADVFRKKLSKEVRYFKRAHLSKTAPAFWESEFVAGLTSGWWSELKVSWKNFSQLDPEWLKANRPWAWRFLGLFFALMILFWRLKARESWAQVLRQPVGLASVIALAVSAAFVSQPIPAVVVVFWIVMGILLPVVVRAYPLSTKQRRDIDVVIACFTLLQIVEAFGLPLALYRILLADVALIVVLYCRRRITVLKASGPGNRLLEFVFRAVFVLAVASAISEAAGYHLLAAFLLSGTVKSGFLVFVAWNLRFVFVNMVLALIQELFDRAHLALRDRELIFDKIRQIFHVVLVALVVVLLTTIWGFYDGVSDAVSGILSLSMAIRGREITCGMIVNAVGIAYLIVATAQVTCSLLEEEVYPRKNISAGAGKSVNTLLLYGAWVIALFSASAALGIEIRQFAFIAGALSVGIGFGLQNIVNNFVSGLILLFERPIKVGDILNIDGQWGTVAKMGLRSTVIRSVAKTELIIPNSDFVTHRVENLTFSDPDYRINVKISVAYGSDTAKVRDLLIEIAAAHADVLDDPMPEAFFIDFGENGLQFELFAWTRDVTLRARVHSDLLFAIDKKFREESIEIPFPRRDVNLRFVAPELMAAVKK